MAKTILPSSSTDALKFRVLARAADSDAYVTGLSNASSGLTITLTSDSSATETVYSGANIEAIVSVGTYASPSAGCVRFAAVGSGPEYEVQVRADAVGTGPAYRVRIAVTGASIEPVEQQIGAVSAFRDNGDILASQAELQAVGTDAATAAGASSNAIDPEGPILSTLGTPASGTLADQLAALLEDTSQIQANQATIVNTLANVAMEATSQAIKAVADKLNAMLEQSGADWRLKAVALSQAPAAPSAADNGAAAATAILATPANKLLTNGTGQVEASNVAITVNPALTGDQATQLQELHAVKPDNKLAVDAQGRVTSTSGGSGTNQTVRFEDSKVVLK
jgi:hypothetical protein